MNISQAKQIPVQKIADHFGGRMSHQKGSDTWYFSPFRPDEKTASFKINEKLNTWFDFAEGKGGSTLDLWIDYNRQDRKNSEAIKSALRGLEAFSATLTKADTKQAIQRQAGSQTAASKGEGEPYRFRILKQPRKIWMDSLKEEVARRGLTLAAVAPYLKQIHFQDTVTEKTYNGIGFQNDKDGWEISVPNPSKGESFKTNIGPKGITSFVRGTNTRAAIFEGFWDYLTWLQAKGGNAGDYDVYVLNSLSFSGELASQLYQRKHQIKSVFLFLDNDPAGEKHLHQIAGALEPHGFTIGSMNHLYEGYKDLNDCWIKDPTARQRFKTTPEIKVSNDTAWDQVQSRHIPFTRP